MVIYFHIGLSKAAPTTLQDFFSVSENIYMPNRFELWPNILQRK